MTEPNAKALADETIPRITLAGVEWPIPKMAIKQNEQIFPIVVAYLRDQQSALASVAGIHGLASVAFVALTRAHDGEQGRPGPITRAEFDDMTIEVGELTKAFHVVMQQSGLRTQEKANGAPVPLAEGETPSPPTGNS
jgi:hypothetical protein